MMDALMFGRLPRWMRWLLMTLSVVAIFLLGVVAQGTIGAWWNQRKVDRQNLDALVLIIQHNVQNGRLQVPPQLQPAAPVPVPAPTPPPPEKK